MNKFLKQGIQMLLSEAVRKSKYPRTKIKIVNLTDSAP